MGEGRKRGKAQCMWRGGRAAGRAAAAEQKSVPFGEKACGVECPSYAKGARVVVTRGEIKIGVLEGCSGPGEHPGVAPRKKTLRQDIKGGYVCDKIVKRGDMWRGRACGAKKRLEGKSKAVCGWMGMGHRPPAARRQEHVAQEIKRQPAVRLGSRGLKVASCRMQAAGATITRAWEDIRRY